MIGELTPEGRKALNRLAREQAKEKLLRDVLFDLNVCKLEGWDAKEYLDELIEILMGIRAKSGKAT